MLFIFNNKFNSRIDAAGMGAPLRPAQANIFMCSFENKWLKDFPHGLNRRYVDKYLHCFPHLILEKSLKSMYLPNIPIHFS